MNYQIVLTWDEATSTFHAHVPRLEGCAVEARSYKQVEVKIRKAIAAWVEAATKAGIPVPEPEENSCLVEDAKPRFTIFWSSEDGAFLAESPDLPGCMADGATYEEALANIKEAAGLWLAVALESDPLPLPERLRALTA